jgi:hypothetical protein
MLGPGILGKEAAEAERLKQQNGAGGGAIQLGKHFADKEAERVRAIQSAIVPFEPAEPANRTMKTPVKASKARTASANRTADVPPAPARPAPAGESYSEKEIEDMLDEDPNLWDRVMGLEAARPGRADGADDRATGDDQAGASRSVGGAREDRAVGRAGAGAVNGHPDRGDCHQSRARQASGAVLNERAE